MPVNVVPNLDAIKALEHGEMRFFAAIGAVMSLTASLEISYFDVFRSATGLAEKQAASIFYAIRNTSTRRDMANTAIMESALNESTKDKWSKLYPRILEMTGNSGPRNLLGHGKVTGKGTVTTRYLYNPKNPAGAVTDPKIVTHAEYEVRQDEAQILAGMKKPKEVDFDVLVAFCSEVIRLNEDLADFLREI